MSPQTGSSACLLFCEQLNPRDNSGLQPLISLDFPKLPYPQRPRSSQTKYFFCKHYYAKLTFASLGWSGRPVWKNKHIPNTGEGSFWPGAWKHLQVFQSASVPNFTSGPNLHRQLYPSKPSVVLEQNVRRCFVSYVPNQRQFPDVMHLLDRLRKCKNN